MKAILITKEGMKFEVEVPDNVGIIIRNDSRKVPPVRAFFFAGDPYTNPPEYVEAKVHYLDESGLPDDVWWQK